MTVDARQRRDFRHQMGMAGGDFVRRRLVVGRCAPDRGGDERVGHDQAVIRALRRGNAGKAVRVHGAHQEVAGAERTVAGEDAARAVGAVRGGREAEDEHPRLRVAKAGHRTAPVGLVPVGRALLAWRCAGSKCAGARTDCRR